VPLGTPGSYASPDAQVGLAIPPLGSVGSLGRNIYTTPAYQAVDLRLTRRVKIGEKVRLNFIADFFNLFNCVNVQKVDTAFTQFGRPISACKTRLMHFGVRLLF